MIIKITITFLFLNLFTFNNLICEFEPPIELRYIRAFGDDVTKPPIIFLDNSNLKFLNSKRIPTPFKNDKINIELDLYSTKSPSLYAKLIHCNADWTESENVFMNDVTNRTSNIDILRAPVYSDYFTYRAILQIPNNQIKFRFAGNWKVAFFNYDDNEKIAETKIFVVDQLLNVDLMIAPDQYNSKFKVNNSGLIIDVNINGNNNLLDNQVNSVALYKNNRWFEPYYISNNKLKNTNDKFRYNLSASNRGFLSYGKTFRIAGMPSENCYRVIDLSSTVYFPRLLSGSSSLPLPDMIRNGNCDFVDDDGANLLGFSQTQLDDYVNFEFVLDPMNNVTNENVFVSGSFNNFRPDKNWIMKFDKEDKKYKLTQLVKRGRHNYLYGTGELNIDDNFIKNYSYDYFEGNTIFHNHTYFAFVYYREIEYGGYDTIVGVTFGKIR